MKTQSQNIAAVLLATLRSMKTSGRTICALPLSAALLLSPGCGISTEPEADEQEMVSDDSVDGVDRVDGDVGEAEQGITPSTKQCDGVLQVQDMDQHTDPLDPDANLSGKYPDGYVPPAPYDFSSRVRPGLAFKHALHCMRQIASDTYEPPETNLDPKDNNPNRCSLTFQTAVTKAIPNLRYYVDPNPGGEVRTVAVGIRGTTGSLWGPDWKCNANSQFQQAVTHTNVFNLPGSPYAGALPTYETTGRGWDERLKIYFTQTFTFTDSTYGTKIVDLRTLLNREVARAKANNQRLRVLVTGHSQGGALTHLAATDIAHWLANTGVKQSVWAVSFNAAQVGQHTTANNVVTKIRQALNAYDDNACPAAGKVCLRLTEFFHAGDIVHQVPQNAGMEWDQPIWNKSYGAPAGYTIDQTQAGAATLPYCGMYWWTQSGSGWTSTEYWHPHKIGIWAKGIDNIPSNHLGCMKEGAW